MEWKQIISFASEKLQIYDFIVQMVMVRARARVCVCVCESYLERKTAR
jgi:hypothetical protein